MQAERHKSDMNIRNNFEWFVKQEEYNLMVSIDSDSILDPLWLPFINDHKPSWVCNTLSLRSIIS